LDNAQAQRRKQRDDLPCRQLQPEHLIDTLGTQYNRRDIRKISFAGDIDNRTGATTDDLQQQRSSALHSATSKLGIYTTLVAMRGIGMQPVGARLACQGNGVEEGAF